MQATTIGKNLTGVATSPASLRAMNEASEALAPMSDIDTSEMEAQKFEYISEAEAVGSVPPPATLKGVAKAGMTRLKGGHPTVLMDKLGERIAFERTGTRLYDALIVKYRAASELVDADVLPAAPRIDDNEDVSSTEAPGEALARIRGEELAHFNLLCEAMESLGGDPTAQTPSADVAAVASMGYMQVLNDPRTTLAQCLNTMLTAELTDNAGWELLITLAEDAGESELAGRFLAALGEEQEHEVIIKSWLAALLAKDAAA